MSYETPQPPTAFGLVRATLSVTDHASRRMAQRGIGQKELWAVLEYGRAEHTRDAIIYVLGQKEVQRHRRFGVRLEQYEGIHVVTSPEGAIMTTYRNHDLRRLRPQRRGRCYRPRSVI